jgi:parallel beta-helix repeat protein
LSSTLFAFSDGIWANDCSSLEVALNNISGTNGEDGISIGMCSDFMIQNNSVYDFSDEGISLYSSHDGVIANNTIKCVIGYRGFSGIEMNNLTNCEILRNDISAYAFGLNNFDSHVCLIDSNMLYKNDYGLMTWSISCNYSRNIFNANLYSNAEDHGEGNLWFKTGGMIT